MAQRKRDIAIIMLKCAIIGFGASEQRAVSGTEMVIPPKRAAGVIEETIDSNVRLQSLSAQLRGGDHVPILPLVLSQPDLVASASQAVGGYVLVAQADTSAEPQAIVQETRNADTPAEPQAVIQEIKSEASLSSGKQRRRKPKMAGVPAGSQVVAQETKEPELPVAQGAKESGSQVAAQETEETDMLDKSPATTQETKNAAAPAEPQAEVERFKVGGVRKKYGMAPIRWGARLSETIGLERHSQTFHGAAGSNIGLGSTTSSSNLVHTQTAEIHAKTYVMQPYIAQLGGSIGVVSSKNTTNTLIGTSPGSTTSNVIGGRSNRLFGDGSLSLFSQSRFPFNMSLGVSDDRGNAGFQTQDTVGKHLELDQSYNALGSTSMYNVGYGRETHTTNSDVLAGGNPNNIGTHSFWRGRYSNTTVEHRINAGVMYNDKLTDSFDNRASRTDNFTVTDSYMPVDSLLSLQSFAYLNSLTDKSTGNNSRTRNLQANTNANWQPEDEDIPLFVDGNVRLFSMSTTNQSIASLTRSLGGNVGARYLFSSNLTGYANGGVTSTNVNGTRDLITTQSGRATYSSNAIRLWKNSLYSWSANGGAANQTGNSSSRSVFGGVGHGLSIPYPFDMFGKKWQMRSAINQSLSTNISRVDGRSITLINGGSVSLSGLLASVRPNKELLGEYGTAEGAMNTTATLSVNDSRTMGGKNPSHSRTYSLMLNLLETSRSVYSRYGIEAEATLGATQGTAGTELAGTGTAKYKKTRVFNVRGLDYLGSLKINTRSNSRVVDVNAQTPKFPWSLDQRLSYKIGQNEVLLRGLVSDEYGVKNASLWLLFRAWRIIGN